MKIFLVRHGQTAWNVAGRWQGSTDIPLDEIGQQQAQRLAEKMATYKLNAIYSSPLQRAAATAQGVADKFSLPIIFRRDLEEIRLGEWEGHTVQEIIAKHPCHYDKWENHPQEKFDPNIETHYELQQRAWKAFDEICQIETGNTLIVTHGAWINRLICKLTDTPLQYRMDFPVSNVGINIVKCIKDGDIRNYDVLTLNDISHLDL